MPPWDVHVAIAKDIFGICEKIAEKVNRVIDEEDIHDLGRRMPKEPRLSEWILDPERAMWLDVRGRKARHKIRDILARGPDWVNAFLLHHALDLLSSRLVAVFVTNARLEEHQKDILEAVCSELDFMCRRRDVLLPYSKLSAFLQQFRANFNPLIYHQDLTSWISEFVKWRKRVEENEDVRSYLRPLLQRLEKRKDVRSNRKKDEMSITISREKVKVGKRLEFKFEFERGVPSEVISAILTSEVMQKVTDRKRDYMQLMYCVSRFAARWSHLLDYALLTPFPRPLIDERLLRVTKKRAAGLGRYVLRICRDFADNEKRRQLIIREVREFERVWLSRYNIVVPQECVEKYAKAFIDGYEIVTSFMSNHI